MRVLQDIAAHARRAGPDPDLTEEGQIWQLRCLGYQLFAVTVLARDALLIMEASARARTVTDADAGEEMAVGTV
jgi:hypothetical protein